MRFPRPAFVFVVLIMLILLVGLGRSGSFASGVAFQVDDEVGKAAYSDNGCARCHSIETQNIEATITLEAMRGPDLGQIGTRRDADWIVAYVKREETQDGDRHRAPYGGSDEDLRLLSAWLTQSP
jgi:cytochrome c553